MRILACSDLHCGLTATRRILDDARQADVLVVAGDLGTEGQGAAPVLDLLKTASCPVIFVAGNHDRLTDLRDACRDWGAGHLLHGEGIRLLGMTFFGLGGEVPRQNAAVWNLALTEVQAARALEGCPSGAVLITHSPPKGLVDRQKDGRHDGSAAIRETLLKRQPRLHLCGHVHACFGQSAAVGDCTVQNLGPLSYWFEV